MLWIRNVMYLLFCASVLGLVTWDAVAMAQGVAKQEGKGPTLEELNASYIRQLRELDRCRITDLVALTSRTNGPEADAACATLFHLAIAGGFCSEAESAAERCLAAKGVGREPRTLATLVRVLAKVEKGNHSQALTAVKGLFEAQGRDEKAVNGDMALAVGEAYLQRLIRDGRYDLARELCECACDEDDAPASLKEHFETRMERLRLLGKDAPPISGADVDGKAVSLSGLKGKVVMINFWATWCPPCVAEIPRLNALAEKFHDRGFEVLGINVDAMHQDVKDTKTALTAVRRFLVSENITWTNLLNRTGADDFTKAYGVEDIPANFLIGRDGKVIALELSGDGLERSVSQALGSGGAGK
jgi:thiol-disulfide isomerase/thioredoxin